VTALADAPVIQQAGVYDIAEDLYLSDPVPGGSLSCSGAKRLLPPSCPALFRWEQEHPVYKDVFDFGSAAHKMVLGAGPELAVIDADNWMTKAAKEARDMARAEGKAAALREHPVASALFSPERGGRPEQSLFWPDAEFGIWRRCRLDWMPDPSAPGRFIIGDYKSAAAADKASIAKAVANYSYNMQAPWYADAVTALGLAEDPYFLFVFQEKTAPYLITVAELDYDAMQAGREKNRLAMEIFRDCKSADSWPGYSQDIELISLPAWARGSNPRGGF
jgi:PDDEXK-like domain of unknown function (DUF3799)